MDKRMFSYGVLWNAFKRLAAAGTAAETSALFCGAAMQACRIPLSDLA